FVLAVSGNSGHSHDFTFAHTQVDRSYVLMSAVDGSRTECKHLFAEFSRLCVSKRWHIVSHNLPSQFFSTQSCCPPRVSYTSGSHYGYVIADEQCFFELVGDEHDRVSLGFEPDEKIEQPFNLRWGKHGGGFVEQEGVGTPE